MKSFMFVATAATVLMTTGALAQTTTATGTTDAAATAATASPAAATSTADINTATKPAERPVKMELYTSTETAMTSATKNEGISTTVNYVGIKGKLAGKSVGIRQIFTADYMTDADQQKNSDLRVGRAYLHLTDPKLFALDNGVEGTGIVRLYLPTSEDDRFVSKGTGAVRLVLITAKSIGKWDFDTTILGQAYGNSQDTFIDRYGKKKNNAEAYLYPSINAGYNFSDKTSLTQSFGTENIWYLGGRAPVRTFNSTTTVAWKALPQLTLLGNLSNDVNIVTPSQDFALGREDELTLLFEASVNL
ncbi:MAG: hypothetical protein V4760_09350 [Bdellovibrionota bacterium]